MYHHLTQGELARTEVLRLDSSAVLAGLPSILLETITFDDGLEFSAHLALGSLA